jgi:uncharacterized protein with HEPN domain
MRSSLRRGECKERDAAYLLDILDAAELAVGYTDDLSFEEFSSNGQCQDAVPRRLEIIGEAARRLAQETRDAHPSLPWQQMIRMRNLLIHQYDDVDTQILWETVRGDLPPLITYLRSIIV